MAALTTERNTGWAQLDGEITPSPLQKGAVKIFNGAMVNTDASGFLVPAADVVNHKCLGWSRDTSDTAGIADGVQRCAVGIGVAKFATTGANAITIADVGKLAYVLDDNNVVRALGTVNSIIAGRVHGVDPNDGQIYVDFRSRA